MDGSSSGIYFTPATTQPDHFVLYLQGGGWCNDQKSCESRCGTRKNGKCSGGLATSTVWANTQYLAGLFSTSANKTALPGANKAYLRYCTGDAHMGNRDASAASFGFNFHGSRTVAAALSLLVNEHGLGSKPGQTLLFGGELTATAAAAHHTQRHQSFPEWQRKPARKDGVATFPPQRTARCWHKSQVLTASPGGSAGGRGAMANLDYLPGLLSDMNVASAPRVLGFPDS